MCLFKFLLSKFQPLMVASVSEIEKSPPHLGRILLVTQTLDRGPLKKIGCVVSKERCKVTLRFSISQSNIEVDFVYLSKGHM